MKGTIPYDDLYAKIAKTGKEVCNDLFNLRAFLLTHGHPTDSLWNYDCLEGLIVSLLRSTYDLVLIPRNALLMSLATL